MYYGLAHVKIVVFTVEVICYIIINVFSIFVYRILLGDKR